MEVLATQTVLIKTLIRQESANTSILSTFPIRTEENLRNVNDCICEENRDLYVRKINF